MAKKNSEVFTVDGSYELGGTAPIEVTGNSWRSKHPAASRFIRQLGKDAYSLATGSIGSLAGGFIDNMFNKFAEDRADARARAWARDQYTEMVKGRRKAGLNPYDVDGSDAPSMVGQSSTETNSPGVDGVQVTQMNQQMELERRLVDSEIELNKAQADAYRGKESRAQDLHSLEVQNLAVKVENESLRSRILSVDATIAEATQGDQIAKSAYELDHLINSINLQFWNIEETKATITEKNNLAVKYYKEGIYLEMQTAFAEAGIQLTYAQVEEVYSQIRVNDSIVGVNAEKMNELKALVGQIEANEKYIAAQTAEVPANARANRNRQRFASGCEVARTLCGVVGTVMTAGAGGSLVPQTSGSSLVMPTRADITLPKPTIGIDGKLY